MIPIIKPYLPPKEILLPRLEEILYSGYIAEGETVIEFEKELGTLLGNPYCCSRIKG